MSTGKTKQCVGNSPKFAFVVRGVPGSGKSTTSKYLAGDSGVIHAVDDLHKDSLGNFLWSEEKEADHYKENFELFRKSCEEGAPVVVCDNINVTRKEYQKYVDCALENDYVASVVILSKPAPSVAALRNKHSVTLEQIKDMYERWED